MQLWLTLNAVTASWLYNIIQTRAGKIYDTLYDYVFYIVN